MIRVAVVLAATLALAACTEGPEPLAPAHAPSAPAEQATYQCSMHPQIIRHEPGSCPICGMALQRVDHGADSATGPGVPGHASFVLSPERQQLIGVTRATVAVRPLERVIRTAATVANDPLLYQTLAEYREAVRTRAIIGRSPVREAHEGAQVLVEAALLKLRRQGVDERTLAAFRHLDPTTLILPGRHVWVYARIYEEEAPLVTPGTPMELEAASLPGGRYDATVLAVDPLVDPMTRTVRARALVATPQAELRPDAYVTATLRIPLGERLAVPRDAILDSGTRRLAFVVSEDGRFTPREVRVGRFAGDYYEVLDGLAAGEQVVTSANFLIDSESRLRAAVAAFGAGAAPAHQH